MILHFLGDTFIPRGSCQRRGLPGIILLGVGMLLLFFAASTRAAPPRLVFTKHAHGLKSAPYVIQKGDYLYAIFRKLGFSERDIPRAIKKTRQLNPGMDLSAPLHPGQTILLPLGPTPSSEKMSGQTSSPGSRALPSGSKALTYTFKQGDTVLRVLRQKTGLSTREIIRTYLGTFLASNSHIIDLNTVHPGEKIIIPALPQEGKAPAVSASAAESPVPSVLSIPSIPEDLTLREKQAWVKTMLSAMGFAFTRGQETFVPRSGRGWLRINTRRTPLATAPWGTLLAFKSESDTTLAPEQLQGSNISLCRVPRTWDPRLVMQALARQFPQHLTVLPDNLPLQQSLGNMQITVHVPVMVQANWTTSPVTYGFTFLGWQEHPFPSLLVSLLEHARIRVVQARRGTRQGVRRINPPFIRAEDLYVPFINYQELATRYQTRHGMTYPVKDPVLTAKPELEAADMTFHWTAGPGRVSLTCPVQRLQTEEQTIVLLDRDSKYPYLVALLRLRGMACHVLAPAQTTSSNQTRPSP
jgi:hypothetical protein